MLSDVAVNFCVILDIGDVGIHDVCKSDETCCSSSCKHLSSLVRHTTFLIGTSQTACKKILKSLFMPVTSGRQSMRLWGRFVRTSGMSRPFLLSSCFHSSSTLSAQMICV